MASSPEIFASVVARRVIALAALVVAGGGFAGCNLPWGQASEAAKAPVAAVQPAKLPAQVPTVNANPVTASPASATSKGKPVVKSVAPVAASAAAGKGAHSLAVHAASSEGEDAPVVTTVPQNTAPAGTSQAHLDDHLTYQYNALGRRDPFQSLVGGQFVGADVGGDAPPDPGGIKVVGIVWGADDQFALVEDVRGNSFVLRKGDKVQNGIVEGLKRDGVIVNITSDGQSQSVVIPLVRKGDQNAR
jgi:hypothetical protein